MKKLKENYLFFITTLLFIFIFIIYFYISSNKHNIIDTNDYRIASLSPSITEFIYDVGLDKYLIANTIYCNYPEDAKNKEKIGSYSDINYEHIAKLKINTVVIQKHMSKQKQKLESMGIKVIEINDTTIDNITNTYNILGKAFNIENITDKRKQQIIDKINDIKQKIPYKEKKYSAVIAIFRNYGAEISALTAAGGNNIYNDILAILNIDNPFKNYKPYIEISKESLLDVNPDFIFDLYHGNNSDNAKNDWKNIPVKAVANDNIIVLSDTYLSISGPRIDMIIEKFADEYFRAVND